MLKKDNINKIKSELRKIGIKPNKRMGQNFLLSDKILNNITDAAELTKEDKILEVGPGLGMLTDRLSRLSKMVIAIEQDRKLTEYLRKKYKNTNVKIVCDNILDYDFDKMDKDYKIIANLPYQISSVFINKIVNLKNTPQLMVLMLQKEVGQRICAKAGSAKRGKLTIFRELVCGCEIVEYVQKNNFYPMPDVDSVIVKFDFHDKNKKLLKDKGFSSLIKIGFSQKRRQIHHPLSAGLRIQRSKIKTILEKLGIDPSLRAEDLKLEDWIRLYEEIKQ